MAHRMIHRNLGRCFALAALLAAFVVTSYAQSAPAFKGGVASGSVDFSGNVGWSNLQGVDNSKHINYGGAGGYNLSPNLTILGEYQHLPMGSITQVVSGTSVKANASYDMYGGAARFNFSDSKRFVPYGVVAAGAARAKATATAQGISASAAINGFYFGVGGGASVYLGRNWGIRPEVRWDRQVFSIAGSTSSQNAVLVGSGIFIQFGGTGGRKSAHN